MVTAERRLLVARKEYSTRCSLACDPGQNTAILAALDSGTLN